LSQAYRIEIFPAGHFPRDNLSNPIHVRFLGQLLDHEIVHCAQPSSIVSNLSVLLSSFVRKRVFLTDLGGGGVSIRSLVRLDRMVDGFLPISEFAARNYPAANTRIIYGGVNPTSFWPREVPRESRFLFVGRVLPHKGINYLIEALPPNVPLDVVGQIGQNAAYFQLLQRVARQKDVHFRAIPIGESRTGSDSLLALQYSRALATVLPSVHVDVYGHSHPDAELLGLTLLESQACGTPVICTDVGGMPETIEDGKTGFIVPPNDPKSLREKMQYFLDNPEEARVMGRRGIERVRRSFTWKMVAERCLNAYAEL
jgi:glycosyltransferase involved in cell wall biosynthesis